MKINNVRNNDVIKNYEKIKMKKNHIICDLKKIKKVEKQSKKKVIKIFYIIILLLIQ